MTKLLVIDDDEIICRGIATCIDWAAHDIKVVDIAFDGELGLQSIEQHQPDVVIVDINMPFLDGLELSYLVRQRYPQIKIILLTAYKEFTFAKKAVELQVYAYLSKPFDNEEVLGAVRKAQHAIEAEKKHRQKIVENMDTIRQQYLSELVGGEVESEKLRFCGMQSALSFFTVACLYAKRVDEVGKGHAAILDSEVTRRMVLEEVRSFAAEKGGIHCCMRADCIVLILESDAREDADCFSDNLKTLLEAIEQKDEYFTSIGLGVTVEGAESIRFSYDQARKAVHYRHYFGNRSLIPFGSIADRAEDGDGNLSLHRLKVMQGVTDQDFASVEQHVQALFAGISSTASPSLSTISILAIELIISAFRASGDESLYEKFLQGGITSFAALGKANDVDEICGLVLKSLAPLRDSLDSPDNGSMQGVLQNAVDFIHHHYADPNLTLKTVADHVHLSPGYLCVLFKQVHSVSYVSYLNHIRMEKAKKLLAATSVKTFEVAFSVGYNSSQYFASSFKKYTGLTPGEYREKEKK